MGFVIFAKLDDFTEEELELCQRINKKYNRRLILLTTRELEPYYMYENTSKEFKIDRHAITFDDMAKNTQTVFYEKLRIDNNDSGVQ